MNLKHKKILRVVCMIMLVGIISISFSNVFGQINKDNMENGTADNVMGTIADVIAAITRYTTGPLTLALTSLVNVVLVVIFSVLWLIFSPVSGAGGLAFPFPDQIIFNKLAFFDPNFINPPTYLGSAGGDLIQDSIVYMLKDLIGNLYYTSFILAGAIFIICAMIIGIKLALSTLAAEKAHYKEALTTWITCLALLFFAHFLILGIFTVNEKIVEIVSESANTIEFEIDLATLVPFVGKTISNFMNSLSSALGNNEREFGIVKATGYGGLLIKFIVQALTGDLASSIVFGVLLGQTCAIIFMYLRRMFYCILLAILAPLIIAADIMKKSVGI